MIKKSQEATESNSPNKHRKPNISQKTGMVI